MIRLQNQVPSIYTSASRDFQFIAKLFDIVLNSVKHNVDDLYDLPTVLNDVQIAELLALTLGFKIKRNYDKNQIIAIASILPQIFKNKGTEKALILAGEALVKAGGLTGKVETTLNNNCIEITLPKELTDIMLFTDLLPYILPAGISVKINRTTKATSNIYLPIGVNDSAFKAELIKDVDISDGKLTGLATSFEENEKAPRVTAFVNLNKNALLNEGQLDMAVIPTLIEPISNNEEEEIS